MEEPGCSSSSIAISKDLFSFSLDRAIPHLIKFCLMANLSSALCCFRCSFGGNPGISDVFLVYQEVQKIPVGSNDAT